MATISFARGVPAPECLAVEALADCARAALERDGTRSSPTAPRPGTRRCASGSPRGTASTRRASSHERLAPGLRLPRAAARAGKRVLVERPTYDRPLKILRELGADVVGLHCDDDGPRSRRARGGARDGEKPAFLYLIPTFQNPSGRTLSEERRRRISSWRASTTAPLRGRPVRARALRGRAAAVAARALGRRAIAYSSSFSKTIAPGLRVGWFVFPEALAREIEATATSTYITPGAARPGDRARVRQPRPLRAEPRTGRGSSARDATRCSRRSTASCPTCGSRGPRAATSSGPRSTASTRPSCSRARRRQASRSSRAPTSTAGPTRCDLRTASSRSTRSPKASRG